MAWHCRVCTPVFPVVPHVENWSDIERLIIPRGDVLYARRIRWRGDHHPCPAFRFGRLFTFHLDHGGDGAIGYPIIPSVVVSKIVQAPADGRARLPRPAHDDEM